VGSRKPLRGEELETLLGRLPARPGVYLMKDLDEKIVYVGKAKELKTRVRSYFRASGDERAFVSSLDRVLGDIEVVVTPSEKDALLLERELIWRHRPRYNVNLLDDKNFLSIRISENHPYPRLLLDRKRPRGGSAPRQGRWFGPYTSAASARVTFRLIQATMGLRTCSDTVFRTRKRPCLLFQMNRCLGPCALEVPPELYSGRVKQAIRFLRGRFHDVLKELQDLMKTAAAELRFEDAARLRDRIAAVRKTLQRQSVIDPSSKDRDVIGLYREGASGVFLLMQIRRGSLLGICRYPLVNIEAPDADVIRQVITQHYESGADIAPELLLPGKVFEGEVEKGDLPLLEEWLSERSGSRVRVFVPQKGKAVRLLEMARENAIEAFRVRLTNATMVTERLGRLAKRLGLSRPPRRIECFDMSTLGGRLSVGSMAVLIDGEPDNSAYRRYRIRSAAPDSDVDMMREVVSRRFRPVLEGEEDGPDLVVLDGGKGQLNAILQLFADLGVVDVDLVALAKGKAERKKGRTARECVFIPGRKNPVFLGPGSDELFLLARVRDEAHRFAVAYHRKLRKKSSLRSILEEVPGVGPVLRRRLLTHFGSLQGVRSATIEQLSKVRGVPPPLAARIHGFLSDLGSLTGDPGTDRQSR
jgi:excinuclease ABC subunit C